MFGSAVPRLWTPPLRRLTAGTSAGFACIRFAREVLGLDLYPWQEWLLTHLLELDTAGRLRFRTAVLLVPRQNGKTLVVKILALFLLYVRGTRLVIGTAQNLDVAEEAWLDAVDMARSVPDLAGEIEHVDMASGKKALRLVGGQRYKVAAANRRGGRGLAGDLVVLDELREHQSWDAWAAVTKTTISRASSLVLGLSSAGDVSSVVLRHLRGMALAGLADAGDAEAAAELSNRASRADPTGDEDDVVGGSGDTLGLFEWSARPGADPRDRSVWAVANPSLGHGITERALAAAQATDPPWVFAQECLGIWSSTTAAGPFPAGAWTAGTDPGSVIAPDSPLAVGVDVSWDRLYAHAVVAGRRPDGNVHVEVMTTRAGTDWVVPWLAERHAGRAWSAVALQEKGAPVAGLLEPLTAAGLPVRAWSGSELGLATGRFYDLVRLAAPGEAKQRLFHLPQPVLDVAAATAATKALGDAWAVDRKRSPGDVAPLVAAIAAVWALDAAPPDPPRVSAYETNRLAFV